jgi:hypothetical protein
VPPGLFENAGAGVDQQHREIGGRSAGRHVAGVLHVTRRVGNDERAPVGGEIAVGDIDGDALFALGLQTVEQQREVRKAELVLLAGGLAPERGRLVFLDRLGVPQQPPDQRRLAVVDGAAGDEAQGPGLTRDRLRPGQGGGLNGSGFNLCGGRRK